MYNIIPLLLILVCLLVIIIVIARKFSLLSNLDIDNIPQEKEGRFKEKIAGNRIKKGIFSQTGKIGNKTGVIFKKISHWGRNCYNRLSSLKKTYEQELRSREEKKDNRLEILWEEVENLNSKENFEEMENKLIEIIGLDSKNSFAFEKLGNLYFENKRYDEAKETYEYLLNLLGEGEEDRQAKVYFYLAWTDTEREKYVEAFSNIKKALSISPHNPRYLDIMVEIAIMLKDKKGAREYLETLKEVNPENQKIGKFEKQ